MSEPVRTDTGQWTFFCLLIASVAAGNIWEAAVGWLAFGVGGFLMGLVAYFAEAIEAGRGKDRERLEAKESWK